jgi:hypothetical protein
LIPLKVNQPFLASATELKSGTQTRREDFCGEKQFFAHRFHIKKLFVLRSLIGRGKPQQKEDEKIIGGRLTTARERGTRVGAKNLLIIISLPRRCRRQFIDDIQTSRGERRSDNK